ncbi:hypothetical protein D3C77_261980 [compost metagenome]|jgi:hypothetical protein
MQERNVKNRSSLRTALLWVAGTVAAVPITKLVERHYDVSIFSPVITGLWNWIMGIVNWLGRDVTLPAWMILLLLTFATLLAVLLLILIYVKVFDSDSASLTDEQMHVFVTVGKSIEVGHPISFEGLVRDAGFSRIVAHNALDVLSGRGLVTPGTNSLGLDYVDLTSAGRAFFLSLRD